MKEVHVDGSQSISVCAPAAIFPATVMFSGCGMPTSLRVWAIAVFIASSAMTPPLVAHATPGVYDDCTNLHARKIAFDVNRALEKAGAASCPEGGPVLDPECLDDCGADVLDFTATPGLASLSIASACDGLSANDCAGLHFDDPIATLSGNDSKPYQYRFVPLCDDGSGSQEWTVNPLIDPPGCDPDEYLTCADGTRAIYWAARGTTNDWIIRFSGGNGDCRKAEETAAEACWMSLQAGGGGTSFDVGRTLTQTGMLGPSGFSTANRVFIRPCAQDRYTGDNRLTSQAIGGGDVIGVLTLRGSRIVKATLEDLAGGPTTLGDASFSHQETLPNLANADSILFAGSSAGAIGLSFLLDRFAAKAAAIASGAVVRGLLDSRLMPSLDNEEADFEVVGNGDSIYGGAPSICRLSG